MRAVEGPRTTRSCGSISGDGCTAARPRPTGCASTSSTRAARPPATSASAIRWCRSRCGRSRATRPPAARSPSSSRRGYEVEVEAGDRSRRRRPTTRVGRLPIRPAREADRPSSRSSSATGRAPTTRRRSRPWSLGRPSRLTIRSWPDDAPWGKRVSGLVKRALPVLGESIGLPWPARSPSWSRRPSADRPAATPACSTRHADSSRSRTTRTTSSCSTKSAHAWFNGTLLADRWANEAFASYYGLAAASDPQGQGEGRRADDRHRTGADPAQRVGRRRSGEDRRPRTTRTPRASPSPARSPSGPARTGCARCGRTRPDRRRCVPAANQRRARLRAGARRRPAPDWRGLLDLLEAKTTARVRRPLADVGRARRRPDPARRAARGARSLRRGGRDGRGVATCRSRSATRCGHWQFDDATAMLDDAAASLPGAPRSRPPRHRPG